MVVDAIDDLEHVGSRGEVGGVAIWEGVCDGFKDVVVCKGGFGVSGIRRHCKMNGKEAEALDDL